MSGPGGKARLAARFFELWSELSAIGASPFGGYRRFSWAPAHLRLGDWFERTARSLELETERDRNGNLWAFWGGKGPGAIVTGSHLDSVPEGGAFDGPLGVVSALLALEELRRRSIEPRRPLAVAVFGEEEGARFGVACLGSRLSAGEIDPEAARKLGDVDGATLEDALSACGVDPSNLGPDPERLASIAAYVELHIEQGRMLAALDAPVALGCAIWPHGRWRCRLTGEANHAGTTLLADRHDPVLVFAGVAQATRALAEAHGAHATIGKVSVEPNAANAIARLVETWIDVRAPEERTLSEMVGELGDAAARAGAEQGVSVEIFPESRTAAVVFDAALRARLRAVLGEVPEIATAAGHDAGILAAHVPAAMLFVRNPSGVSHAPAESAELEDCLAGVQALTAALADLVSS